MAGFRLVFMLAAVFALVSVTPTSAYSDEHDIQLQHVNSAIADDGSIRLALEFNGPAPETRVIRSDNRTVHVVLVGASLAKNSHFASLHFGEISSGTFAGFAGIGMRLDLRLRDRITVRTEPSGNTVFVHIPAVKGDLEAHLSGGKPASIAARIARSVVSTSTPTSVTTVMRLSYADVSEVAGALVKGAVVPSNDTFTATSPFAALNTPGDSSSSSSSSSNSGTSRPPSYVSIPAAALLPKDTPQGVRFDEHVAVDRRLNAVILTGTPAEVDALKSLVALLDTPSRSVLLETQIVELTTTAAHDIGIDYAAGGTAFAAASFGTKNGGPTSASFSAAAALSALEQSGQAKILARPRIIAINNRPAAILSGEAVPIFTSIVIPGGSSTVINNQIQYINVGVSLQILPRIAADGRVTSQIFCEVSSIIDYIGTTPRIAVRQELTSAIVNDAESLIVGGLLQETEIKSLRKVPSLGNLPLIGQFFRNDSTNQQSTNLYIVITPHVLTSDSGSTAEATPSTPLALPAIPGPNALPGNAAEPLKPEKP